MRKNNGQAPMIIPAISHCLFEAMPNCSDFIMQIVEGTIVSKKTIADDATNH